MPWITKAHIAIATDVSMAAEVNRSSSASQLAVDNRLLARAPDVIGEVLQNDPKVAGAVADKILADNSIMKFKRLTTSDPLVFNNLDTGTYQITLASIVTALGLPGGGLHGVLTVQRWTTSFGRVGVAYFETNEQPPRRWSYAWATSASVPSLGWQLITPDMTNVRRTTRLVHSASSPLVFDDLATGQYQITRTVDSQALGLPGDKYGVLSVDRWAITGGEQPGMAVFTTREASPEIWTYVLRSAAEGTPGPWAQIVGGQQKADYAIRHAHLESRQAIRVGGPIDVGTATPVCIIWDDYPNALRDKGVIAAATTHGIPITFAVCSRTMDAAYAAELGGEGITWDEVDAWVAAGTVEVANHGATHRGSTLTPDMLYDEIVNGLSELQAHLPSSPPITSWVMPTTGPSGWGGFNSGATPDAWASSAGQLILGHHAVATGTDSVRPDRTRPMLGFPVQGDNRQWAEGVGTTMAQRQTYITDLYGTDRGIAISAHASWIGETGRWTQADVETYFAWLAAEQTAGRIKLMHLSQWAWARSGN